MSSTQVDIQERAVARPPADAESLIQLTERLSSAIAAETRLLGERPARELAPMQEEKQRLATIYGREMTALAANPERLSGFDPLLRTRLREATARFQRIVAEHERRVRAMATVSERLIKAIADEVSRRHQPVRGYDGNATLRPVAMSGIAVRPTSLALNQMV